MNTELKIKIIFEDVKKDGEVSGTLVSVIIPLVIQPKLTT